MCKIPPELNWYPIVLALHVSYTKPSKTSLLLQNKILAPLPKTTEESKEIQANKLWLNEICALNVAYSKLFDVHVKITMSSRN